MGRLDSDNRSGCGEKEYTEIIIHNMTADKEYCTQMTQELKLET